MTTPMHETVAAPGGGAATAFGVAQRLFAVALLNGLEHFRAHPELWNTVLAGLTEREIEQAAIHFAANPPRAMLGYLREQLRAPTVAVVLASDRPSEQFLGDELDRQVEGRAYAGGGAEMIRGAIHAKQLGVLCYSEHPDVSLMLYEWARYVLRAHADWFEEQGLYGVAFTGGGEMAPDTRYLPAEIYTYAQDWTFRGLSLLAVPMRKPGTHLYAFMDGADVDVAGLKPGVTMHREQ